MRRILRHQRVRDEGSEITGREKQHQNANVSVDKKQIGIDVVCNVISMEP